MSQRLFKRAYQKYCCFVDASRCSVNLLALGQSRLKLDSCLSLSLCFPLSWGLRPWRLHLLLLGHGSCRSIQLDRLLETCRTLGLGVVTGQHLLRSLLLGTFLRVIDDGLLDDRGFSLRRGVLTRPCHGHSPLLFFDRGRSGGSRLRALIRLLLRLVHPFLLILRLRWRLVSLDSLLADGYSRWRFVDSSCLLRL